MTLPPAKRPRRSTTKYTASSHDHDDGTPSDGRQGSSEHQVAAPSSALRTSSQKSKGLAAANAKRPISSYFDTKAVSRQERQPVQNGKISETGKTNTAEAEDERGKEERKEGLDDSIEDISDVEEDLVVLTENVDIKLPLDRRKALVQSTCSTKSDRVTSVPMNSQRFKLEANGDTRFIDTGLPELDSRPWAERFSPVSLDELAVHKKKVLDVRLWLESVLSRRSRKRLLVLKGPAGAGKTTTTRLLAQAMNVDISEWRNPVGTEYSSEGYTSMSTRFEDFLGRSAKYGRLNMEEENDPPPRTASASSQSGSNKHKIVLIEEFPTAFHSASTALQSFRLSVLQYLSSPTSALMSSYTQKEGASGDLVPLIMIVTETRTTSITSSSDSFTVHRLLGSEILNHPAVTQIEFNPVASTILTKALNLVLQKEARHSGRMSFPKSSTLHRLGEAGDVRSAIGSLEFLCAKSKNCADESGKKPLTTRGKSRHEATETEDTMLDIAASRESNVGLFHAVGKVVYNKRRPCTDEPLTHPPDHLSGCFRALVPENPVDQLMNETGSDNETFIAALHENYAWSCEGISMVENLEGCLDALSDGDLLLGSNHGVGRRRNHIAYGTTSESLKQDDIAFQLVVRGLLFALPYPVKRSGQPKSSVGKWAANRDAYKMLYPTSMRIQRQMEEIEGLIDQIHLRLRSAMDLTIYPSHPKGHSAQGVQRSTSDGSVHHPDTENEPLAEGNGYAPIRLNLAGTKGEMVLETLPYITKIERQRRASSMLESLNSITQFKGIKTSQDDTSDDDEDTIERAVDGGKTPRTFADSKLDNSVLSEGAPFIGQVEKLYLSDDDIEDE